MAEPKYYCITSGKGGVGKTCLAVNLAFALAHQGKRVLLVDGDLGLANIDVLLDLEVGVTIWEILDRGIEPQAALISVHPRLDILPASSGVPEMANLGSNDQGLLQEMLQGLAAPYQHILLDTSAGLGLAVLWFNSISDLSLVVTTPDPTALTDAYALIKVLTQSHQGCRFEVVLNAVQDDREARITFETLAAAAHRFLGLNLDFLGAVPDDPVVKKAVRQQMPFLQSAPQSKAAQAVIKLADRLQGLSFPETGPTSTPGLRGQSLGHKASDTNLI